MAECLFLPCAPIGAVSVILLKVQSANMTPFHHQRYFRNVSGFPVAGLHGGDQRHAAQKTVCTRSWHQVAQRVRFGHFCAAAGRCASRLLWPDLHSPHRYHHLHLAIGTLLFVDVPSPPRTEAVRQGQGSIWVESVYGFRYIFQRPSLLGLQIVFLAGNFLAGLHVDGAHDPGTHRQQ